MTAPATGKGSLPAVLTIGGSDCSGGAGIQADLKTLWALDVYALVAVTSVTAQDREGIKHRRDLSVSTITAQINAAFGTADILAAKVGMIGSIAAADAIFGRLEEHGVEHIVVDPVRTASAGGDLAAEGLTEHLLARWLPKITLITPNCQEARILTGAPVTTLEEARTAAVSLVNAGAEALLITGIKNQRESSDYFTNGKDNLILTYPRLPYDAHGTGCTLSSGIAGYLARGLDLPDAVRAAGQFVHRNLAEALFLAEGWRVMGHSR